MSSLIFLLNHWTPAWSLFGHIKEICLNLCSNLQVDLILIEWRLDLFTWKIFFLICHCHNYSKTPGPVNFPNPLIIRLKFLQKGKNCKPLYWLINAQRYFPSTWKFLQLKRRSQVIFVEQGLLYVNQWISECECIHCTLQVCGRKWAREQARGHVSPEGLGAARLHILGVLSSIRSHAARAHRSEHWTWRRCTGEVVQLWCERSSKVCCSNSARAARSLQGVCQLYVLRAIAHRPLAQTRGLHSLRLDESRHRHSRHRVRLDRCPPHSLAPQGVSKKVPLSLPARRTILSVNLN